MGRGGGGGAKGNAEPGEEGQALIGAAQGRVERGRATHGWKV